MHVFSSFTNERGGNAWHGPKKTPGDEAGRRQPERREKETYMDL